MSESDDVPYLKGHSAPFEALSSAFENISECGKFRPLKNPHTLFSHTVKNWNEICL